MSFLKFGKWSALPLKIQLHHAFQLKVLLCKCWDLSYFSCLLTSLLCFHPFFLLHCEWIPPFHLLVFQFLLYCAHLNSNNPAVTLLILRLFFSVSAKSFSPWQVHYGFGESEWQCNVVGEKGLILSFIRRGIGQSLESHPPLSLPPAQPLPQALLPSCLLSCSFFRISSLDLLCCFHLPLALGGMLLTVTPAIIAIDNRYASMCLCSGLSFASSHVHSGYQLRILPGSIFPIPLWCF